MAHFLLITTLYNMNTIQRDSWRKGHPSDKRTLSGKRKQRLYDATVPNTEQTIRSVYDHETNCYYDTKELSIESVPDYDNQKLSIEYAGQTELRTYTSTAKCVFGETEKL
jgi:hypothetical protein